MANDDLSDVNLSDDSLVDVTHEPVVPPADTTPTSIVTPTSVVTPLKQELQLDYKDIAVTSSRSCNNFFDDDDEDEDGEEEGRAGGVGNFLSKSFSFGSQTALSGTTGSGFNFTTPNLGHSLQPRYSKDQKKKKKKKKYVSGF